MKKFSKELVLNKETISVLDDKEKMNVRGGLEEAFASCQENSCNGSSQRFCASCTTGSCNKEVQEAPVLA